MPLKTTFSARSQKSAIVFGRTLTDKESDTDVFEDWLLFLLACILHVTSIEKD